MKDLLTELKAMQAELKQKAADSEYFSAKRAYNGAANKLRLLIDKYSK